MKKSQSATLFKRTPTSRSVAPLPRFDYASEPGFAMPAAQLGNNRFFYPEVSIAGSYSNNRDHVQVRVLEVSITARTLDVGFTVSGDGNRVSSNHRSQ